MSISAAYETAANYRAVVGSTDSGKDAEILIDLTAVSRYLEGRLGRFFTKDATPVARVYLPPTNSATLRVDDLAAAPTAIKLDTSGDNTFATTLAATDYELLPLNAARGPEVRPFTVIRLTPWGNYSGFLTTQRVQVTAQFGWPAVPVPVKRATIHLTAILRLETPRATNRIPELGDAMNASPEAQHIIRQLTDSYAVYRYV
jgi:hypothetical protein